MAEYEDLVAATLAFPNVSEKHLMFISKSGFTESVRRRAKEEKTKLYVLDDLFEQGENFGSE